MFVNVMVKVASSPAKNADDDGVMVTETPPPPSASAALAALPLPLLCEADVIEA